MTQQERQERVNTELTLSLAVFFYVIVTFILFGLGIT